MKNIKTDTKNMIFVAIFTALTGVGAFINIPIPNVPFTLQYFFCALAGIILGAKLGGLSQLLYVFIGLAGVPIFTKGGGLGYIFQPTFGYLIGFIVAGYVIGYLSERSRELTTIKVFAISLIGLSIIYAIGVSYFYVIANYYLGQVASVWYVFYWGFLTCIGGDLLLTAIIAMVAPKILYGIKKSGINIRG